MMLILAATLFLPLFPFSIVLNWVLKRVANPVVRFLLLLLWPQIGIAVLSLASQKITDDIVAWALVSSMLYAIRLLTVRDLGIWAGFIASSALALTWGFVRDGSELEMRIFAFSFSLPAALLTLLTWPLTRRFGAAFAGVPSGLANFVPKLSWILVVTVFAAIATPPLPGFFAMLGLLNKLDGPAALAVLVIWLLWGWAATKLLQAFISGGDRVEAIADIGRMTTVLYTSLMALFVVAGILLTGGML